MQKTVLVITDGIGYKADSICNAFQDAETPTYDRLFKETPHQLIATSGLSVGLPKGQMGNSEVGHMTIGSGRILYQDLVRISLALDNGTIRDNYTLNKILNSSNRIHLIGLLSDGGVHSHIKHTIGLALFAQEMKKRVFLHLITDGRDVSPTSALNYIKEIENISNNNISIASIGGRFYTMDRDNRWDRIEKGYNAIVNSYPKIKNIKEYILSQYKKNIYDEFIIPSALDNYKGLKNGDAIIMTNFRSDRVREITTSLGSQEFNKFKRNRLKLNIATITEYDSSFNYPIIFPKEAPINTLAQVISENGLSQTHIAETEKYAHVTFFFNGGIEKPFKNENRILIPSPQVKTYDMKPQMSAVEVSNKVLQAMEEESDFIVVNFANGDMVGHTGNYEAAKIAVNSVDKELNRILQKAKEKNYASIITSDHGNCEEMKDKNGNILTNHTVGDVWCFIIANGVDKIKKGMGLNNIAPTILKLMGLKIPDEMDEPLI
jgi:2,3-bisphosphoglycerate-independent phosphoglycerate mutase